jgi:PST family polysaccharide transporter
MVPIGKAKQKNTKDMVFAGEMNRLKSKIKNNVLIGNFMYLSVLQLVNYVLPVVTLPYLIRVLKPDLFGLTVYAQTFIMYFLIITDYGFNLTATREVSLNKGRNDKISEIFSNVMGTKIMLMVLSLAVLFVAVNVVPDFSRNKLLFVYTAGVLIGQVFFPVWLFQGFQEMKFLMYFNVSIRIIVTLMIFVFIKSPSDFLKVNLLNSIANMAVGGYSFYYAVRKYGIRFRFPKIHSMVGELKNSFMIFVSNIALQICTGSGIIMLGLLSAKGQVGHYSVADKVIMIPRQLLGVFAQVIYPHVCHLHQSGGSMRRFFMKSSLPFTLLIAGCSVLMFVFSEEIVWLMTDRQMPEIARLISIMSVVPVIVCLNIPAYQMLLVRNQKNVYSFIFIFAAALNLLMNAVWIENSGAEGTAFSIVITESFITAALIIALALTSGKRPYHGQ